MQKKKLFVEVRRASLNIVWISGQVKLCSALVAQLQIVNDYQSAAVACYALKLFKQLLLGFKGRILLNRMHFIYMLIKN